MEERNALVEKLIAAAQPKDLTPRYLEILGDYIMDAITKEEKKEHTVLTKNRMVTVNKRETSFEGLASKFENGEDGIYNLITEDKNILFTPKISITQADIEEVPGLRELRECIDEIEEQAKQATGKKKYLLKKQVIEMRRDQYVLKNAYRAPMAPIASPRGINKITLDERQWVDENGEPQSEGLITFFNPKHISAILCNYNALKISVQGKFQSDFYYLMEAFDDLMRKALAPYPLYMDLAKYKIDGKPNLEIQELLNKKHGIKHSIEYISSLWRNKIPKLISEYAKEEFLIWYYTEQEPGKWKKCSRCGQIKLAHNRFFSKNNTSKDGWYSICKECRNKKK